MKGNRFPRAAALGLFVGAVFSVHLLLVHVLFWWLPLAIVLAPAHAAIISGLARLFPRLRHGADRLDAAQTTGEHSHVLHNPRAYDWLAKAVTLGGETRFRRRTVALAELQPGERVLDVGCGTGTLLIEAAKRVEPSGSAHGIDRSPEMLARARRKAAAQSTKADFREGSSAQLPFPDASFDAVFSTLMLHHLPVSMQLETIAEMRRVLRPGGRIVIVDMQRPKNISAIFSHIGLVHLFRSRATMPNWQRIEEILAQKGVQSISRQPIWGETVCALAGRITSNRLGQQTDSLQIEVPGCTCDFDSLRPNHSSTIPTKSQSIKGLKIFGSFGRKDRPQRKEEYGYRETKNRQDHRRPVTKSAKLQPARTGAVHV